MKKILFLLLCTVSIYGQTYQNPTFGTVKTMTAPTVTSTPHLGTVETNGTISKIPSVMNQNANSGVLDFDGFTINVDPTKYNIGAGTGYISNPETGIATKVTWAAQTAQTTPYLATSVATYVLKDSAGATVLQNSYPTTTQFRTHIYLGKLVHTTFTTILFVVNEPSRMYHVSGDLHDLVSTFGSMNRSGNMISPNGANLQINVSAGETYREGANFSTNRNSPNITNEPAVNATSFRNKFRNGSGGWSAVNTTTVDPNYYDNGTGILALVPNNKFTLKVVYRFGGTGTIHMDYGQAVYDNMTAADNGISATVASDPDTKNFASRIGWIIIQQGTTSLLDVTKYKFVPADKIGERAATASGVTSLQGAYNNSVTPQITTTPTGGALAIKQGSGSDTDTVLAAQNSSGTGTFSVTGAGNITGGTYNGYTPENQANKSDSYTVSSSITYASSKALVDGLATKSPLVGYVNIVDYGAVGDGVTNSTTAIQNALNTGKNVFVPDGSYLVSSTLIVKSYQTITGQSLNAEIKTNSNIELISNNLVPDNFIQRFKIENIKLSNKFPVTAGAGATVWTVNLKNPLHCSVENVWFLGNFSDSDYNVNNKGGLLFYADGSINFAFLNSVKGCLFDKAAVRIETSDSDVFDSYVWAHPLGVPGIDLRSSNISVQRCNGIIPTRTNGGIYLSSSAAFCRIIGNFFDGSASPVQSGYAIVGESNTDNVISGNSFWNADKGGIYLKDVSLYSITGNSFRDNNKSDNSYSDIVVEGNVLGSSTIIATGNTFYQNRSLTNKAYAIQEVNSGVNPLLNNYSNNKIQGDYLNPAILATNPTTWGVQGGGVVPAISNQGGYVDLDAAVVIGDGSDKNISGITDNDILIFKKGSNIQARRGFSQMALSSNTEGNWYSSTYKETNPATQIILDALGGEIAFNTAVSGTSGSSISWNTNLKVNNTGAILAGTPTAPTAAPGTNTTQIATTAFVQGAVGSYVDLTTNQTVAGNKTFSGLTTLGNASNYVKVDMSNNIVEKINNSGNVSWRLTDIGVGQGAFRMGTPSAYIEGRESGPQYLKSSITFEAPSFIATAGTVRLKSYTVATLPAGTQGDTAYVTDATAPTYLGTLTGGGSVVCPVFYNGSAWVSH